MEPTLSIVGDPGQKPVGICGSGIIDIISELYRCRIINAKGLFIREGSRVLLTPDAEKVTSTNSLSISRFRYFINICKLFRYFYCDKAIFLHRFSPSGMPKPDWGQWESPLMFLVMEVSF